MLLLLLLFLLLLLTVEFFAVNPNVEAYLISLRLTPEQYRWLEHTARYLEGETGCEVTISSIMMRLMEKGLPLFEEELQSLRARANARKKRFPHLELVTRAPAANSPSLSPHPRGKTQK